MQSNTQARAHARALAGASVIGTSLAALLGVAYVAGGAARDAHDQKLTQPMAAAGGLLHEASSGGTGSEGIAQNAVLTRVGLDAEAPQSAIAPATSPIIGLQAADAPKASANPGPAAAPYHAGGAGARDCLTTAVYYEARGEGQAGQAAVAQVILNRVRHPAFPKSVCAVVYQGGGHSCQFSFVCNGAMKGRRESAAWNRARAIADRALAGFVVAGVGSATNFHASRVAPDWRGMIRVGQVGAHIFYRFGGRASYGGHSAISRSFPDLSAPLPVADAGNKPAYRVLGPSSGASDGRLVLASNTTFSSPGHNEPVVAAKPMAQPAPVAAKPVSPAPMAAETTRIASAAAS